ncbi:MULTISPECIES: nitrous oxide reductase accessory protein NosL [Sulfurimonas]|uniref:nitrous oxide reductase accessory protein NosL n=1 Tax=Sulfurimonas TaxID=202746 RepID=UPI0012645D24|nr:nitrous oxide reductase accessory protein NosL [Sulfurimonas indica]
MLKIFLFSLSVLIMSGCQNITPYVKTDKKPEAAKQEKTQEVALKKDAKKPKMQKMFQTVDAKDAILVQKGEKKEHCAVCGMNLTKFYKTSHAAKLEGKNIQYCSIHCLTAHINEGAELENPMVVDVTTLKFIPVTEAFYVVGSDVPGTMSSVSKYAFKSLDAAKAFQKKHGGKILDFYSAWQEAKKDFQK